MFSSHIPSNSAIFSLIIEFRLSRNTLYDTYYYCRYPRFSQVTPTYFVDLLILFSIFAVLIEGYNYFHPFYMEKLAPCVKEDLLKLRVNEFSLRP